MPTLILDTSGPIAFLLLRTPGPPDVQVTITPPRDLTKNLLSLIKNLIPNDLSEIIVGTGPGSFTGTRQGIIVAQTLGFALSIPVRALPSPELSCLFSPSPVR